MRQFLSCMAAVLCVPAAALGQPKDAAGETPVSLILGPGQGTATPWRQGSCRLGGGNIHVTQTAPDTISVTMTGVVVAKSHPFKTSEAGFSCDVEQAFDVVFHSPKVKGAKLVMWQRAVGLLRCEGRFCRSGAVAGIAIPGHAEIACGSAAILALELPARAVNCGEYLSVHDRAGPAWVPVVPARYVLRQTFGISASRGPGWFCKAASAEFAPDPALQGDWISQREPFHGAEKKDFGFQVILRVIPEDADRGEDLKTATRR